MAKCSARRRTGGIAGKLNGGGNSCRRIVQCGDRNCIGIHVAETFCEFTVLGVSSKYEGDEKRESSFCNRNFK